MYVRENDEEVRSLSCEELYVLSALMRKRIGITLIPSHNKSSITCEFVLVLDEIRVLEKFDTTLGPRHIHTDLITKRIGIDLAALEGKRFVIDVVDAVL